MTARRFLDWDVDVDEVRRIAYESGAPYSFSDAEVCAVIEAEAAEWVEFRRRLNNEWLKSAKRDEYHEPIPVSWIVDRAAARLWDDMRLPFVFIRAEYLDELRAQRGAA